MSAPVQRLCVVGLGLLGGSVALAARRRGVAAEVVGATRSPAARERALAHGLVDRIADPAEAVRGCDLVVLGTPVGAMATVLRGLAPALADRSVVTDVGSVKAPLEETLPGLLPPGRHYVGSHPMAGSHERGPEHARSDLLEGAVCVVTLGSAPESARERVAAFWTALGARVVLRSPEQHDREVAWVSHLPHLLAFAFGASLAGAPGRAGELAGGGFRDFTRIGRSDPALWADILVANRKALMAPLGAATAALEELGQALEAGDAEALERLLFAARSALWDPPEGPGETGRACGGSESRSESSSRSSSESAPSSSHSEDPKPSL